MSANSLVSIIMPAYNTGKYIEASILSVIAQTFKNWELLVIDDCSTDNTKEVLVKYAQLDARIKPIFRNINGGKPSIAKNSAIPYIKGSYIAFLDSDDLWMEDKLQKQLSIMQKKDYALCYTGGNLINQDSSTIGFFIPKYQCGNIFQEMLLRYEINNQSVLIKRNLFTKFNEDITIGEDYNIFMNIVFNNKVCAIKEKLVAYRVHENSITKSKIDLSDGVLFTLSELNNKYSILKSYPFRYTICWLKSFRFKIFRAY